MDPGTGKTEFSGEIDSYDETEEDLRSWAIKHDGELSATGPYNRSGDSGDKSRTMVDAHGHTVKVESNGDTTTYKAELNRNPENMQPLRDLEDALDTNFNL